MVGLNTRLNVMVKYDLICKVARVMNGPTFKYKLAIQQWQQY